MFQFLLIVQTLVAVAMISVILMQRSEGGGLAGGGSPSGMMSARGAADFLTRSTTILAIIFIGLSIVLAGLAANTGGPRQIDPNLLRQGPAAPAPSPAQPLVPGAQPGAAPAPAPAQPPQGNQTGAPLAQ